MHTTLLETRLAGTPRSRFFQELFGNSAHFPIANILLEILVEGPLNYLRAPDVYIITLASLVQAYWLSRWQITSTPRRFWGNLIGPALYTVIEAVIEGSSFFARPHHIAYWGFSILIGALQSIGPRLPGALNAAALILAGLTQKPCQMT